MSRILQRAAAHGCSAALLLLMVGLFVLPSKALAACQAAATADFDGTCRSDILWQNDVSSLVDIWLISGTTLSSSGAPANPGPGWRVVGVGDFNGDGMADILWQNTGTAEIAMWFMNGTSIGSTGYPTNPGSGWSVQGIGDFNGDGMADILWRNQGSGQIVVWFMNGSNIANTLTISNPGFSWNVLGVGDFNGDGMADILWRNQASGQISVWLMNVSGIASTGFIDNPGVTWSVAGVGDFNGDGMADILWQDAATGELSVWLMNGTSMTTSGSPGNPSLPGTPWSVQQIGDFDGDGKADILFYNNQTSEVDIWLMDGTIMASSGSPATPGLEWRVQTPPPYGVPAPAQAAGYQIKTFDSSALGNTAGQLYFPTSFYYQTFGTAAANSNGSFTMTNGTNLPMVATARHDTTKPNKWGGECFTQGGFFDVYAAWTPFAGSGQTSWPQIGLADVNTTGTNAVGPWNQWGIEPITATAPPTTGVTTIGIPAWVGTNTTTLSNVSITGSTGQFSGTFSGLFVGETVTISGSPGGSGSIAGFTNPTTYYVSAVNATAQTFTLETMGQGALMTTAGTLSGATYALGLAGTVTFSDAETRVVSFTPGTTSISWIGPLTGSALTSALSVSWGANFGDWPELPVVEADYPTVSSLGVGSLINWYAQLGSGMKTHTSFTSVNGVDTSTPHHYSVLWVPAAASAQGYANWYLDGKLVDSATWNVYDPTLPPAPTGTETNSKSWAGGSAFSVMDTRCMMIDMSTATGNLAPMTVYAVSVWQAAASNNQTQ